jgi:DNA primase
MSEIEDIKNRLSIEEVVGSYIKLEKAGSNFKAVCPFHNEKTPSFYLTPDKGFYKCFGCGASGDIFTFVERYEGISFSDALKKLAERAGVQLRQESNSEEKQKEKAEKERLLKALSEITIF